MKLYRNTLLSLLALFVLPALAACNAPAGNDDVAATDGADDAFLADGKADSLGVREGSAAACGVLKLASEASAALLTNELRLDRRAVANILSYRLGPDGTAGTADDRRFDSLAQLDDIKYMGTVAFTKLTDYVRRKDLACRELDLQVIAFSDVHGQLDPVPVTNVGNVGGGAALGTYVLQERATNPNTVVVSAGDLFGASPPLAMYFEEKPMVKTANLIGLHVNTVGNHEFDRGLTHLRSMIELARFPFISANLSNVRANMTCPSKPSARCVEPFVILPMGGLKVAFIGITTPETPGLVRPGMMGSITISDPIAAANAARTQAAAQGAKVFVAVAHLGGAPSATPGGEPTGPLIDFAKGLRGFDAVIGGHTHTELNTTIGQMPVVENKSQSQTYVRLTFKYNFALRTVSQHAASVVVPLATVAPAQAVVDLLKPYRDELSAAFDVPVGTAAGLFERDGTVERSREVALGDLVADAIRAHEQTQIAFINGGGLRAPLPSTYAPADKALRRTAAGYATGPAYDLVLGDVFAVLPFGNAVATQSVTGAQLWKMLEHAVDAMPSAKGYFAQISGFKFTYDSTRPVGSRVLSATLDDGTAIASDTHTYTMVTSDFIAGGGDGYTLLAGLPAKAGDPMADILRAAIHARGTITPATNARIVNRAP